MFASRYCPLAPHATAFGGWPGVAESSGPARHAVKVFRPATIWRGRSVSRGARNCPPGDAEGSRRVGRRAADRDRAPRRSWCWTKGCGIESGKHPGCSMRIGVLVISCLLSTKAQALECDQVVSLINADVPLHVVKQTLESTATPIDSDLVACLIRAGAEREVLVYFQRLVDTGGNASDDAPISGPAGASEKLHPVVEPTGIPNVRSEEEREWVSVERLSNDRYLIGSKTYAWREIRPKLLARRESAAAGIVRRSDRLRAVGVVAVGVGSALLGAASVMTSLRALEDCSLSGCRWNATPALVMMATGAPVLIGGAIAVPVSSRMRVRALEVRVNGTMAGGTSGSTGLQIALSTAW